MIGKKEVCQPAFPCLRRSCPLSTKALSFALIKLLEGPICAESAKIEGRHKLYKAGQYSDTPILVGYNADEGATFPAAHDPQAYVVGLHQRYGRFTEKLRNYTERERGLSQKQHTICSATPHLAGTPALGSGCNRRQATPKRSSTILTIIRSIPLVLPVPVSARRTAMKCRLSFSSSGCPVDRSQIPRTGTWDGERSIAAWG
jgi:hypothetical protein